MFSERSEVPGMFYQPDTIINELKYVPDLSTTAVAAVTARLDDYDDGYGLPLDVAVEVMMECGLSLKQALAVREAAEAAEALSSGALVQVRA